MNNKVLYFFDLGKSTKIIYEHKEKEDKRKYTKILNEECLKRITTLEGRIRAMTLYWGSNYNVPIFINDDVCFLKVEKNLWINIINVEKIVEKSIIFKCGKVVNFTLSNRYLSKKMNKINEIIKNVKK